MLLFLFPIIEFGWIILSIIRFSDDMFYVLVPVKIVLTRFLCTWVPSTGYTKLGASLWCVEVMVLTSPLPGGVGLLSHMEVFFLALLRCCFVCIFLFFFIKFQTFLIAAADRAVSSISLSSHDYVLQATARYKGQGLCFLSQNCERNIAKRTARLQVCLSCLKSHLTA